MGQLAPRCRPVLRCEKAAFKKDHAMNHFRLACLMLPLLTLSAGAQEDRPSSQPTADLEKSLKSFLIEKKDPALRDCLIALAQKGCPVRRRTHPAAVGDRRDLRGPVQRLP
jgi:hypothetical protein